MPWSRPGSDGWWRPGSSGRSSACATTTAPDRDDVGPVDADHVGGTGEVGEPGGELLDDGRPRSAAFAGAAAAARVGRQPRDAHPADQPAQQRRAACARSSSCRPPSDRRWSATCSTTSTSSPLLGRAGRAGERPEQRRAREPVQLGDLARTVAARTAAAQRPHGRTWSTRRSTEIVGRPPQLERAISNLVDNAVKYSDGANPIEIVVDGTTVTVRDRVGIGPGTDDVRDLRSLLPRRRRAHRARFGPRPVDRRRIVRSQGGTVRPQPRRWRRRGRLHAAVGVSAKSAPPLREPAPPAGFEPATHGLEVRRSVQLSYGGVREKVAIRASRAGALSCDTLGGRSSARLERQVVALEVGGSSPLGHPNAPSLPSRKSGLVTSGPLRL